MSASTSEGRVRTRVWDAWVRLFHWSLIPLIAFSWWSASGRFEWRLPLVGSGRLEWEPHLEWHRWSGYTVLALVLFRIGWGFIGSDTARFSDFVRGFGAIGGYVKKLVGGARGPVIGHNPIGGWSVLLMILLLVAQTTLGLFSIDIDGIESGPLAMFVSFDQGRLASAVHHLVFNAILALIGLHLLAVLFYALVKRDNLVGPMITGARTVAAPSPRTPRMAPLWRALVLIALAAGFVYAVAHAFWLHV